MTWWENMITWGLSVLVLGVTICGIRNNKKDNKALMRQNTQSEINRINSELYQIEREIERLEKPLSGVYGIYHDVSHNNQLSELRERKRNLEEQRKKLQAQL